MSRYHLPPDFDLPALAAKLASNQRLVFGDRQSLTTTYLDTFDWRLWRAGFVLAEEQNGGHRLVLSEPDREPLVVTVGERPRLADDLPAGHLGHTIGPILGIRALIPLGVARVCRRDGRLENTDGEMLAPMRIEEVEPLNREGRASAPPFVTLEIRGRSREALPGFIDGLAATTGHDLDAAAAARGRVPGDYGSSLRFVLDPGQSAEEALRTIFLELLTTLEVNVEGTIDDVDSEFLHDLRVACRRTRSALTQLKGVLATEAVASFSAGFKWLGGVTGPLRDLDVFLLAIPAYRAVLPEHLVPDLVPLEELIVSERTRAHASVVRALRTRRFAELVAGWREVLETANPEPTPAGGNRCPILPRGGFPRPLGGSSSGAPGSARTRRQRRCIVFASTPRSSATSSSSSAACIRRRESTNGSRSSNNSRTSSADSTTCRSSANGSPISRPGSTPTHGSIPRASSPWAGSQEPSRRARRSFGRRFTTRSPDFRAPP